MRLLIALSLVFLSCYHQVKSVEDEGQRRACVPVEARYLPSGGTFEDVEAAMVGVDNHVFGRQILQRSCVSDTAGTGQKMRRIFNFEHTVFGHHLGHCRISDSGQ